MKSILAGLARGSRDEDVRIVLVGGWALNEYGVARQTVDRAVLGLVAILVAVAFACPAQRSFRDRSVCITVSAGDTWFTEF